MSNCSTEVPLIFEISKKGNIGCSLPKCDVPQTDISKLIPQVFLKKKESNLPEVNEVEVVRHFTRLSRRNIGVDTHFYPLGSCTMKYNPKINEEVSVLPGFASHHPYTPEKLSQGSIALMFELQECLKEISGMDAVSLQPVAGAHGELTSLLIVRAYHDRKKRSPRQILIPDTAHGTNPASAALAGFEVVQVKSNQEGDIDLEDLKSKLSDNTAALMLTNPNTLGLFEKEILSITKLVHQHGGLVYYDGANMNAVMGICRPGDMGVDLMHFNLHKTFSTPHGGGGPGSGPIGVRRELIDFLPVPVIEKNKDSYMLNYFKPLSIGKMHGFYGNFGVCVKAYVYIKMMGAEGLRKASEDAVLNANYLFNKLKPYFTVPYNRICKHEFVLSAKNYKDKGIKAMDIAKRLLDYGFHAPTMYFPLIVEECMMAEPTETETKETLDAFADVLRKIIEEIKTDPDIVKNAPHTLPVTRLDEVAAARQPNIKYSF